MRKTYWILLLIPVIFFALLQASADVHPTVIVAGDENYPPYEFVDKNGAYKGFNIDVMKALSDELGVRVEIRPMPWQDALEALEAGKVDAIQGMTRSASREEKFSFTNALLQNAQVIFVRQGTDNIVELHDLKGSTIAIQSGDISEELVERIPEVQVIIYSNQEQAIRALLDGTVDAFVGNRLTGLYILQSLKQFDKIKIVGEPLYITEYCAATQKGNEVLLGLLNTGLGKLKQNGEYDRIYNKWFGETVTDRSILWKKLIIIVNSILVVVIIVISMVFYWNRSLKKIVDSRTSELAAVNQELYRQQERLEQSSRLRGKILESILDGIIAFSTEGEVLGANHAAKELLQIDKEESLTIESFKADSSFIYEGCLQAIQGSVWKKSLIWEKGSKGTINIECSIYPIKGPEEKVEGIIIVLHDYTERKLLNEAKEYDKLKTEFFANMSHEFRTPLSVILAAAQLLELKARGGTQQDIKDGIAKSITSIKQNVNRLSRLVNNIIDITKADTGFLQLQQKNQNIVSIIEDATMSVAALIENKGINIEFDTDVEEKMMACDAEKIERVILNLLSNSVKFTQKGGSIFVRIQDGEKHIRISVRDTGIGIPKDKQGLIFDRFRQVDKSISRVSEGSGIGLSLVKSLVELHGGSISVESTYGKGSVFEILLPVILLEDVDDKHVTEMLNTKKAEIEFSDIYF